MSRGPGTEAGKTGPRAIPAPLLPLLQKVEVMDAAATGAFVLGNERQHRAAVFVQHGRVCWATAVGMRGRLTDLLMEKGSGQSKRDVIEKLYRECRSSRIPLGETLVANGVVTVEQLRSALLQHTSEALMLVQEATDGEWSWEPHSEASYDAVFTFLPSEVYVSVVAGRRIEESHAAERTLRALMPDGDGCGLAFLRALGAEPIAAFGCDLSIDELRDAGRWLAGTLDVAGALNPGALVVLSTSARRSIVAWENAGTSYLVSCADSSEATYVVAKHRR